MNTKYITLAACAATFAANAHAAQLNFEDVLYAQWRSTQEIWGVGPEIYSKGYVLRYAPAPGEPYPTYFFAMGPKWSYNYRNTIAINANSCSASVTLVAQDNNPFNLQSIDLQELNGVESVGVSVTFTGYTSGQQTVTHSVTLNGTTDWETVEFPAAARDGQLVPLASGRGHEGAIPLYADGALYAGKLKAGQTIRQKLDGKPAYLVPAKGRIEVSGTNGHAVTAKARDGVAVVDQAEIELKALEDSEIVLVETDQLN